MEWLPWAPFLASYDGCLLVGASLVGAVALVLCTYLPLRTSRPPDSLVGPVNWSFTDSWATTLTTVGAIVGTILATSKALPETTTLLTRAGFAGLSLLFGLLVLVPPLLYKAFAHFTSAAPPKPTDPPHYQGFVRVFVTACAITSWGVIGQLMTAALLLEEMTLPPAPTLPAPLSRTFLLLLLAALVLVVVYTFRWMTVIIEAAVPKPVPGPGFAPAEARAWTLL